MGATIKVRHTRPVEGLNYKLEDGRPVSLGQTVEVSMNMGVTLVRLHWGELVHDEPGPVFRLDEKRPEEGEE